MNNGSNGAEIAYLCFKYAYEILNDKVQEGFTSTIRKARARKILCEDGSMSEEIFASISEEVFATVPGVVENDIRLTSLFSPAIVMLAFSIELGLKAIIKSESGQDTRGHKIDELFKSLVQDSKNTITSEVCNQLKISDNEFAQLLTANATAFIDWRYFYENTRNANYKFLQTLNQSIAILVYSNFG
jgi:hypothetical protein